MATNEEEENEASQFNHEEQLMMDSLMALNTGGDGPGSVSMSSSQHGNPSNAGSGINWKQGRSLLRQYLQEIGYTDTIIDVRSNRVRSLLGLNNNLNHANNNLNNSVNEVNEDGNLNDMNSSVIKMGKNPIGKGRTGHPSSGIITDTEASVLATFEFLNDQRPSNRSASNQTGSTGSSGDDDDDDGEEDEMATDGWREDMVDDLDGKCFYSFILFFRVINYNIFNSFFFISPSTHPMNGS